MPEFGFLTTLTIALAAALVLGLISQRFGLSPLVGYLVVTLPDLAGRMPVVAMARMMNPDLVIVTRARYLKERAMLEEMGATLMRYEEAEAAVALAETLLERIGARSEAIQEEVTRVRTELSAL